MLSEDHFKYAALYFRNSSTNTPALNFTMPSRPVSGYGSVWFIAVLTGLVITMTACALIVAATISLFLNTAGRRLYNQMFDVVLRAPMYFYETNPVGKF